MKARLTLLLFIISLTGLAQSRTIRGEVTDDRSGEKLTSASVRSALNNQLGVYADENGSFEITLMQNDTITVSFMGYEDESIPVINVTEEKVIVRMKLRTNNIREVEISAERMIAEEFTVRKIRKLDIYTNPSAKADPILAVNSTPSATTTDESANISLRGGSPAETGIFLNNVPINDAVRYSQLNGIGTFSIFNTALINNVQVYPGNPPLEYGNSTSGVIALQTDENIPEQPSHSVALTLANVGIYSSRKLNDKSSLTFFSNYQPDKFIRTINSRALKNLKKFSSADLGIHYLRKVGNSAVVRIFNYSLVETYRFRYSQPAYDGSFVQDKARNFTVANVRKRIGKTEISFNQGLSFSKADYQYGITDIDLRMNDLFSSLNLQHMSQGSEWKTGISFDHKASDFKGYLPTFEYAQRENHPVIYASSGEQINNPEIYGYYKHYLGARWIAGGGFRKNIAGDNRKDYLSLQGNIHYTPAEAWNINFSAGSYYKYQLPQGDDNKPLLMESRQFSLDIQRQQNAFESSLSLYIKHTDLAGDKSSIRGAEVFTRYKVNSNLRFQLSLTSLEASRRKDEIKESSPYNIHYFLRGNVEYKVRGTWTITTVFLVRQGSYYQPVAGTVYHDDLQVYEPVYAPEAQRLPAYRTIDLSVSKIFMITPNATAVAFVSTGNIVNFENVRSYTYNQDYTQQEAYLFSLRTLYFGMVINF